MHRSKANDVNTHPPSLSILILSLVERTEKYLLPLLRTLQHQCVGVENKVEILVETDNRWRSIGRKRNEILRLAQGDFITYVDDDDMVSHDYIESILGVIRKEEEEHRSAPDCIVFDVWVKGYDILNMQSPHGSLCRYGLEFEHQNLPDGTFLRKPNCRMVYKRSMALLVPFVDVNCGEDDVWGQTMARHIPLTSQLRIHKILYFYNWSVMDSEAGGVAETRAELIHKGKLSPQSELI